MPSISSHGSKQAVQFVPRGFTPALTQIQQPEHPHTSAPPAKNKHPEDGYKNSPWANSISSVFSRVPWNTVVWWGGGLLCSTWPMELTGRSFSKISGSMCMTCVLCFLWAQTKFSIFTDGHWTIIHLGLWVKSGMGVVCLGFLLCNQLQCSTTHCDPQGFLLSSIFCNFLPDPFSWNFKSLSTKEK